MNLVTKRDGRVVAFDKSRIENAIRKAFSEVGDISEDDFKLIGKIADEIATIKNDLSVEEIQDIVEEKLMKSRRKDVAKRYILYRDMRTRERERNSSLIRSVSEKLNASNVQNQNANVDERSFGGRIGAAGGEVLKHQALNYIMSDMANGTHSGKMRVSLIHLFIYLKSFLAAFGILHFFGKLNHF